MREQDGGGVQRVADGEHVRVALALLDEADLAQNVLVLVRVSAEDRDDAVSGDHLAGENLHEGGLAGTVAPQQSVDHVLPDGERDVVECRGGAVTLADAAGDDDLTHRAFSQVSIMDLISSVVRPSLWASSSSGCRNWSENCSRRRWRSLDCAPGETNMTLHR